MSERLFRDPRREAALELRGHVVLPLLGPEELAQAWALYRAEHGECFPPQPRDGVHMTIWCSDRAYKERVRAARVPPAGEPIALLPPHRLPPIDAADLEALPAGA